MRCFWKDGNNFCSSFGFFKISIQSKASFESLNTIHMKVVVTLRRSAKHTALTLGSCYTIAAGWFCLPWRGYFKTSLATSLYSRGKGAFEKPLLSLCALHSTCSLCRCYNTCYHSLRHVIVKGLLILESLPVVCKWVPSHLSWEIQVIGVCQRSFTCAGLIGHKGLGWRGHFWPSLTIF